MSYEILRRAVESQFTANWNGTVYIDHGDNHDFTPPQDSPWVRLITNIIFTENAQIGTDFQRSTGIITVMCFVPVGSGEKVINEMVDEAASVFQNKVFGGVDCFITSPARIGRTGNWYQVNAKTDFKYDVFS